MLTFKITVYNAFVNNPISYYTYLNIYSILYMQISYEQWTSLNFTRIKSTLKIIVKLPIQLDHLQ